MNSGWCSSSFDDPADGTRPDKEVAPSEKWNLKAGWAPIGTFERLGVNARKMFRVFLSCNEEIVSSVIVEFVVRGERIILRLWSKHKRQCLIRFYLTKDKLVLLQVRGKSSKLLKRLNTFPRIPNNIIKLFTREYHEPRTVAIVKRFDAIIRCFYSIMDPYHHVHGS